MSNNTGTLVTSPIRPNSPDDLIASAFANEIMGGVHSYTSSTDRDAIFTARREWGMLCYVINDNKTYQLTYGYNDTVITNNLNWKEFSGSGGGSTEWINSVISVLTTEPVSPVDGDRYLLGKKPTDSLSGTNWAPLQSTQVAQWNSSQSTWVYTTPLNGMSVRVDNQDNSIYRFEGNFPTGSWQKEKENQVRYISANLISGASYSSTSEPYLDSYDNEILYIVKFDNQNTGTKVSLSINGLPHKLVKKTTGASLTDIVTNELTTNYQYHVTFNGVSDYFELVDTTSTGSGTGLLNKYYIQSAETITVPPFTEYWIYGNLTIDGTLDNYGHVIVANGSLINAGTFNDYGTYSNIYFAEINGLGQPNYVPRWKTSYMLTATSSIYDDGQTVDITSSTFSVNSNIVIPSGAAAGYVLTSDSNGVATWQSGYSKYTATHSFTAGVTYSVPHNLNSSAIIVNFWDENVGDLVVPNVKKVSLNTLDVRFSSSLSNVRIVIMS